MRSTARARVGSQPADVAGARGAGGSERGEVGGCLGQRGAGQRGPLPQLAGRGWFWAGCWPRETPRELFGAQGCGPAVRSRGGGSRRSPGCLASARERALARHGSSAHGRLCAKVQLGSEVGWSWWPLWGQVSCRPERVCASGAVQGGGMSCPGAASGASAPLERARACVRRGPCVPGSNLQAPRPPAGRMAAPRN